MHKNTYPAKKLNFINFEVALEHKGGLVNHRAYYIVIRRGVDDWYTPFTAFWDKATGMFHDHIDEDGYAMSPIQMAYKNAWVAELVLPNF